MNITTMNQSFKSTGAKNLQISGNQSVTADSSTDTVSHTVGILLWPLCIPFCQWIKWR